MIIEIHRMIWRRERLWMWCISQFKIHIISFWFRPRKLLQLLLTSFDANWLAKHLICSIMLTNFRLEIMLLSRYLSSFASGFVIKILCFLYRKLRQCHIHSKMVETICFNQIFCIYWLELFKITVYSEFLFIMKYFS